MWDAKDFPDKPIALVMNSWVSGLGVVRSLGVKGVPILALDPDPWAFGLYSKYARRSICPDPLRSEEAFVDFLIDIGKRLPVRGILFPTADPYVVAIAKARDRLERYFWIPFSPWKIIREIVDKELQYKKAAKADIPIPETFFPKSKLEAEEIGKTIKYPVILKPAYSHPFVANYGIKAVKVNSRQELTREYEKYTSAGHKMLVQEIVGREGDELYEFFSYTDRAGEPVASFVQRKLEQFPADFGTGTVFESADEPEIVELGLKLLKAFGYYGISFSEFKRDPAAPYGRPVGADGEFKLMELNPRTTHCNDLATACGVNFPHIVYEHLLGKAMEKTDAYPCGRRTGLASLGVRWIHLEERLSKQRKILIRVGRRGASGNKRIIFAVFTSSDPVPELVYIFHAVYLRARNFLAAVRALLVKSLSGKK
ncbi:MAG: hypothetical protein AMS15_07865 [Planctomycetes bacterium DG_23]|nr:MAG: hypothetical protein AMS15_07865 [Planctomycetes bacterium DG_23]